MAKHTMSATAHAPRMVVEEGFSAYLRSGVVIRGPVVYEAVLRRVGPAGETDAPDEITGSDLWHMRPCSGHTGLSHAGVSLIFSNAEPEDLNDYIRLSTPPPSPPPPPKKRRRTRRQK